MKRVVTIVTLACLMVAMTAGFAFATVCTNGACGDSMACVPIAAPICPMDSDQAMRHTSCDHENQAQQRETVSAAPMHVHAALPARALAIPPACALRGLSSTSHVPDARGAPHLGMVIRT